MSELSLDDLRFEAKHLHRAYTERAPWALERLGRYTGDPQGPKRADFLHAIAKEQGFDSWPKLKHAAQTIGLDRAQRQQRLKIALFRGQTDKIAALLDETPDLAEGLFALQCALYQRAEVEAALTRDPNLATRKFGPRRAILHLAFSRWHQARPDLTDDMLAVAGALRAHGADVNDTFVMGPEDGHPLSALYGAIGHADNMVLGRWLLDHGANPNDGESLYHATELGHHEGLKMLLDAGANPRSTNALLRAMDFHDHGAVQLLLDHGARPDEYHEGQTASDAPVFTPALHHAARRGCDAQMVALLLDAGADPAAIYQGTSVYGFAKVHGSRALIDEIEARGAQTPLSREEALLARASEGHESPDSYIDPAKLPEAYQNLIREILHLPGKLPTLRRLVALGVPFDKPDGQGVTPVQIAGWEGLPEVMGYFIKLMADLSHINGYGGTLLSTIIHGSENAPDRATRDHIGCLRLALEAGVALPLAAITSAGRANVAQFLADWADARPGQVV